MNTAASSLRVALLALGSQLVFGEGDDSTRPDEETIPKEGAEGDAAEKLPSFLNQYTIVSYTITAVLLAFLLYMLSMLWVSFKAGDDGTDEFDSDAKADNEARRKARALARKAKAEALAKEAAGGKTE
jgi:hypothetical protein